MFLVYNFILPALPTPFNPVLRIVPDGQDPIDRIISTTNSANVTSITGNLDSDGNIVSVNITFTLTTTNVIETTDDSGMISTRTETIKSNESATFGAYEGMGTAQKNGDITLGAPLGVITIPGGNNGKNDNQQLKLNIKRW